MSVVGFVRGPAGDAAAPILDPSQRAVVELADDASAAVLGAPGTGKTTTLIETVVDRVLHRGWSTNEVLVLTTARTTASRLRDAIALRLQRPTTGPMARTVNSLAFEIVGDASRRAGRTAPRLVTGGEQDADIAALLEGHIDEGTGPVWPADLPAEVRRTRRFRTELRDLLMRATEYDVSPEALRNFGETTRHPEWVAAADFATEYYEIVSTLRETQLDSSELARFAVAAIESEAPGERVEALRLVLVDDLQEATESTIAVVRALAARGVRVIAFGDPDVAANAFRGGEPDALGRLATELAIPDLATLVLGTSHRQDPTLRAFTAAVTERIGAASAGTQRRAVGGAPAIPTPLAVIEATTPARAWAAIARELRERHLDGGVPWREMAVVVRSRSQLEIVRRSLALAEVPVRSSLGGAALRDDRAARALLNLVDVAIGRAPLTAENATELLLGPFGGLDRLGLRRLRLALKAEEFAGGGSRPADDLLVEGLAAPGRFVTIDHRVGRSAERLAGTLAALRDSDGSIEELLWLAWERSGLARTWYEQALGSGVVADEANRNLDGIVALFTAAKRFAERQPDAPPENFLADVLDADVPEDTLSPQSGNDAVLVTTAAGTVGLEVDTVVVTGLQDRAWPNLRLRGSLLAPQELVRVVLGLDSSTIDERRQVLGDELRMFALAVSRARRRVILASVANDDEAPSVFLGLVPDGTEVIDSSTARPLTLRGVTGRLRRQLASATTTAGAREAAASTLAALAEQGVPGADPRDWHGLVDISSTGPLFDEVPVPVSPSRIDKLEESPLDWFLDTIAGSDPGVIANVGTIVHWAMETVEDPSTEALWEAVDSRWAELVFEAPWLSERQRTLARGFTEALAEYLGDFRAEGKRLVAAEGRFELEVDRAIVRGSIDRVEQDATGKVTIVDLKTGSPVTSRPKIDAHPQLAAYQLAYTEGKFDELLEGSEHAPGGAKLLFVKQGVRGKRYREAVQQPLTEEQLDAFRERIRAAAKLIASAEFDGVLELPAFGYGDDVLLRMHRVRAVSSD